MENRLWQYRCEKCNKVVKASELNTLTVREATAVPGQRSLVAMKLCSSCTYKLRNYLYGEDY